METLKNVMNWCQQSMQMPVIYQYTFYFKDYIWDPNTGLPKYGNIRLILKYGKIRLILVWNSNIGIILIPNKIAWYSDNLIKTTVMPTFEYQTK